jgi:hypothetical protein
MKDSFTGTQTITLQPGTSKVPYTFTFPINTSATANDGAIPFGDTIASVLVKVFSEAGTDVTTFILSAVATVALTVVSVKLQYPTGVGAPGAGRYSLEFVLTMASTAVMEFDFTRVYVKDITA